MSIVVYRYKKKDFTAVKQQLELGLDDMTAKTLEWFNQTVSTWEHKPTFTVKRGPLTRFIGTSDKNYTRVNWGTIPHAIDPQKGKFLKLPATFVAKSGRSGDTLYTMVHPTGGVREGAVFLGPNKVKKQSIRARRFDKVIASLAREIIVYTMNQRLGQG